MFLKNPQAGLASERRNAQLVVRYRDLIIADGGTS